MAKDNIESSINSFLSNPVKGLQTDYSEKNNDKDIWIYARNKSLYSHFNKKPGIYCLHYLPLDIKYVGSSVNLRKRIYSHINAILKGNHRNTNFHKLDLSKDIYNDWKFYCLEELPENSGREILEKVEQEYIDSGDFVLNVRKIAVNCNMGKTYEEVYGLEKAEEIKKKLSDSHKGLVTNTQGLKDYWTDERRKFQHSSFVGKPKQAFKNKLLRVINVNTKEEFLFITIRQCAKELKISKSGISNVLNKDLLLLRKYKIDRVDEK